jgi:hypothetical protein
MASAAAAVGGAASTSSAGREGAPLGAAGAPVADLLQLLDEQEAIFRELAPRYKAYADVRGPYWAWGMGMNCAMTRAAA